MVFSVSPVNPLGLEQEQLLVKRVVKAAPHELLSLFCERVTETNKVLGQ
jgi:hypothetical protein